MCTYLDLRCTPIYSTVPIPPRNWSLLSFFILSIFQYHSEYCGTSLFLSVGMSSSLFSQFFSLCFSFKLLLSSHLPITSVKKSSSLSLIPQSQLPLAIKIVSSSIYNSPFLICHHIQLNLSLNHHISITTDPINWYFNLFCLCYPITSSYWTSPFSLWHIVKFFDQ